MRVFIRSINQSNLASCANGASEDDADTTAGYYASSSLHVCVVLLCFHQFTSNVGCILFLFCRQNLLLDPEEQVDFCVFYKAFKGLFMQAIGDLLEELDERFRVIESALLASCRVCLLVRTT